MVTIHTLLYGDKYTYDDVNRIAASVSNIDCRFVCHTDQGEKLRKDGLYENIILRWADTELGTFNKVDILGQDWGHSLYLDLDVVIQTEDLSNYFTFDNCICKTYWKPEGFEAEHGGGDFNSSVMSWMGISGLPIKKHFEENPYKWIKKYNGCDDKYLFHEHKNKFQVYPLGNIYSYMFGIDHKTDVSPRGRKYRPEPGICLLNGQDRFDFNLRTDYYSHFSNNKVG